MARPVNADPERTRTRLLGAAATHFSRRGVEPASLRDVARTAGVSLATIHYYFGDKEALYDACLEHAYAEAGRDLAPMAGMLRDLARETGRAARSDAGVLRAIDQLVREAFRFSRGHRAIVQLLMRPVLDQGELEPRWRDGVLAPFLEQVSGLVARVSGRAPGAVRLDVHSLVALVMRYSLSTPAELARFAGLPRGTSDAVAVATIEDHLVDLATRVYEASR